MVGGVAVQQNLSLAGLGYQIALVSPGIGEIPVRDVGLERPDEACRGKPVPPPPGTKTALPSSRSVKRIRSGAAAVGAHEGQSRHQRNHQTRLTRYRKFHGTENRVESLAGDADRSGVAEGMGFRTVPVPSSSTGSPLT